MRRFGERFDVILSPVFPTAAPPHGEVAEPDELHDAAQPHGLAGGDGPLRHVGRRAADRRAGRGAPVARRVALAAALALERALGGYQPPPVGRARARVPSQAIRSVR